MIFLSACIATSITMHTFSFFFYNYYIWSNCHDFCIIVIIILCLVTDLFSVVLLLKQRWSPPLFQLSYCSTFRTTCNVSSTALSCSESIECFLGMASKFVFKLFLLFQGFHLSLASSHILCCTFIVPLHKLFYDTTTTTTTTTTTIQCRDVVWCTKSTASNKVGNVLGVPQRDSRGTSELLM